MDPWLPKGAGGARNWMEMLHRRRISPVKRGSAMGGEIGLLALQADQNQVVWVKGVFRPVLTVQWCKMSGFAV